MQTRLDKPDNEARTQKKEGNGHPPDRPRQAVYGINQIVHLRFQGHYVIMILLKVIETLFHTSESFITFRPSFRFHHFVLAISSSQKEILISL
jgi:hypothetical protein